MERKSYTLRTRQVLKDNFKGWVTVMKSWSIVFYNVDVRSAEGVYNTNAENPIIRVGDVVRIPYPSNSRYNDGYYSVLEVIPNYPDRSLEVFVAKCEPKYDVFDWVDF